MACDRGNVVKTVMVYIFQRSADQYRGRNEHVRIKLKRRVSSEGVLRSI